MSLVEGIQVDDVTFSPRTGFSLFQGDVAYFSSRDPLSILESITNFHGDAVNSRPQIVTVTFGHLNPDAPTGQSLDILLGHPARGYLAATLPDDIYVALDEGLPPLPEAFNAYYLGCPTGLNPEWARISHLQMAHGVISFLTTGTVSVPGARLVPIDDMPPRGAYLPGEQETEEKLQRSTAPFTVPLEDEPEW